MNKRDHIYIFIIMLMVFSVITVMTLTLSSSPRAGENLNFAATIVSIILAVIAIIYTFVDSSGQKQSVLILRETIDRLDQTVTRSNDISENSENLVNNLTDLQNQMIIELKKMSDWRNDVNSLMNEIANEMKSKGNGTDKMTEDILKKIDAISKVTSNPFDRKRNYKATIVREINEAILKILSEDIPGQFGYSKNTIRNLLRNNFNLDVDPSVLTTCISLLLQDGAIYKKSDEGEEYYFKSS